MSIQIDALIKKRYALPTEHGSWIWWIGPFLIGAAAAGNYSTHLIWLALAMLAAFLFRQPVSMLVKTFSRRRPESERMPALIWGVAYAGIALVAFMVLLRLGHTRLLYLVIPGIPVFIWHLRLVSQRAERGQRGIELVGAGVLALAAPAAYWVAGGTQNDLAWILWALSWLQSAASIVLVYQRLAQRKQEPAGQITARLKQGQRVLAYHLFNLGLALYFYLAGGIPLLVVLAFGVMLIDALEGILRPAVGEKPARIGVRQLTTSSLFVGISILGFLLATS
ncbi:MAG: YwiC-like family protein [Anaerolineales bacterium]|jgi:hypothetical protein